MYYKFLNSKEMKTNQELLYSTFMLLSPRGSLGVPACVCARARACVARGGGAAGEPHCCSSHHARGVGLELSQADPLFLTILLIEPTVPAPEMQGQSCQQGKAPCTSQPNAAQL